MNEERLTHTANILYRVHKENKPFGLAYWVQHGFKGEGLIEVLTEIPCGFAACAVGYAAADERFKKEGLVHST